jgi:hypothetical protein
MADLSCDSTAQEAGGIVARRPQRALTVESVEHRHVTTAADVSRSAVRLR